MALRTHSYAISSDRGYGSEAQFFTAPEKDAYASRVTKHGVAGHTAVDDSGSFLRSVGSIPIDSWTSSPFYPDAPNSHSFAVLGQMSITNVALGALNLYQAAKETAKAQDIGDKKGFRLKLLGLGTTFGQVGSGLISKGYSTATIGTMVSSNPIWKSIPRSGLPATSPQAFYMLAPLFQTCFRSIMILKKNTKRKEALTICAAA